MRTLIPENAVLIPENAARVFKGVIFDVYQWQQELFDGSHTTFEMLKRPDTVVVIAVRDNKILILDQEQSGRSSFYDLPCGRHDVVSETELDAARREVLEETGTSFADWKLVAVEQPQSKVDWLIYTFIATNFISETEQNLDAGERIQVELKSFDDAKKLMGDPKVRFPNKTLMEAGSLEELLALPDISK